MFLLVLKHNRILIPLLYRKSSNISVKSPPYILPVDIVIIVNFRRFFKISSRGSFVSLVFFFLLFWAPMSFIFLSIKFYTTDLLDNLLCQGFWYYQTNSKVFYLQHFLTLSAFLWMQDRAVNRLCQAFINTSRACFCFCICTCNSVNTLNGNTWELLISFYKDIYRSFFSN